MGMNRPSSPQHPLLSPKTNLKHLSENQMVMLEFPPHRGLKAKNLWQTLNCHSFET